MPVGSTLTVRTRGRVFEAVRLYDEVSRKSVPNWSVQSAGHGVAGM